MSTNHTPGPWIAQADPEHKGKLIAAAPELLEALQALLEFAETYGPSDRSSYDDWAGYFDAAHAAIKKAGGVQ